MALQPVQDPQPHRMRQRPQRLRIGDLQVAVAVLERHVSKVPSQVWAWQARCRTWLGATVQGWRTRSLSNWPRRTGWPPGMRTGTSDGSRWTGTWYGSVSD